MFDGRNWRARCTFGVLISSLFLWTSLVTGCENYGVKATAGADTVSIALPSQIGQGTAHLFLYRIKSRRTNQRLGVGRTFRIEEERQVRAVLQMEGVQTGSPLLLHSMWINPDGNEVYTKEVQVRRDDWLNEARRDTLAKGRLLLEPEADFVELESRYGVDPARLEEELHKPVERRKFKTGTWMVRVYLFRKLLLETSFELLDEE
jgi:hypothetical protein